MIASLTQLALKTQRGHTHPHMHTHPHARLSMHTHPHACSRTHTHPNSLAHAHTPTPWLPANPATDMTFKHKKHVKTNNTMPFHFVSCFLLQLCLRWSPKTVGRRLQSVHFSTTSHCGGFKSSHSARLARFSQQHNRTPAPPISNRDSLNLAATPVMSESTDTSEPERGRKQKKREREGEG